MDQILTSLSDYPLTHGEERPGRMARPRHPFRTLMAAALALGAVAFLFANEPHGGAIRGDLAAAASRLKDVPQNASDARVDAVLRDEFVGEDATIDPSDFPTAVAVTLHGLDRASCLDALRTARRIEGGVVVQLQGYGSGAECGDNNEMTWRLMP
jgi:hypothetical protein